MKKLIILNFLILMFAVGCQNTMPVKSEIIKKIGTRGEIYKPEGKGPFPAVVLLHGCGGVYQGYHDWAEQFQSMGYVAYVVDSLGPRGKLHSCGAGLEPSPKDRVEDALAAKAFLAGKDFVNKNKILVMGWSHGAITAMMIAEGVKENPGDIPFAGALAFYPYCRTDYQGEKLAMPLEILIGELDDWTPAVRCQEYAKKALENKENSMEITVFPDAHHGFDFEGVDMIIYGHVLRGDSRAAAKAREKVQVFLKKYL